MVFLFLTWYLDLKKLLILSMLLFSMFSLLIFLETSLLCLILTIMLLTLWLICVISWRYFIFLIIYLLFATKSLCDVGRVGKLSIKILWKKLGWDPIVIVLEDVFISACQREDKELIRPFFDITMSTVFWSSLPFKLLFRLVMFIIVVAFYFLVAVEDGCNWKERICREES